MRNEKRYRLAFTNQEIKLLEKIVSEETRKQLQSWLELIHEKKPIDEFSEEMKKIWHHTSLLEGLRGKIEESIEVSKRTTEKFRISRKLQESFLTHKLLKNMRDYPSLKHPDKGQAP